MAVGPLTGTLFLAHLTAAAGGSSTSRGSLVNYAKERSLWKDGPIRIRVTSWPTTGAAGKASALRFSLRTPSGSTITQSIQINRGDTGWHAFQRPTTGSTTIPAGWFCISDRALGACNYSTPGGMVSDPTGDAFAWSGEIEYQPTPPLAP